NADRIEGPGRWGAIVALRAGGVAAGSHRGFRVAVRIRHPLPGGRHHRSAGCALPHLPARPFGPLERHPVTADHSLVAHELTLSYGDRTVIRDLDLELVPGRITVIVGANGSGKSTLLKSMARLLSPQSGSVVLEGTDTPRMPTTEVARILGLLPQSPIAPEGIIVSDLVGRGRHPHQGAFARWTVEDDRAVADALRMTSIVDLADRAVDELSGGQRQ